VQPDVSGGEHDVAVLKIGKPQQILLVRLGDFGIAEPVADRDDQTEQSIP